MTATCLLILVSISTVSADVGVRAAPRPSSDSSDTAPRKASSLREAQPRSTQTGSYRNGQLIGDAQSRAIKPRAVAFNGPGAALDPDDLDPDDLGSLVYGETQVDDAGEKSDNNASQDTLQVSSETGSASQDEEPGDGHDGVTQHYAFVEDLAVFLHEPSGASLA